MLQFVLKACKLVATIANCVKVAKMDNIQDCRILINREFIFDKMSKIELQLFYVGSIWCECLASVNQIKQLEQAKINFTKL